MTNEKDNQGFGQSGGTTKKIFFNKRRKICPFDGHRRSKKKAMKIDYKDVKAISRFISESGKMTPSRITSVSFCKQRELSIAIKRARFLALLPFRTL